MITCGRKDLPHLCMSRTSEDYPTCKRNGYDIFLHIVTPLSCVIYFVGGL